MQSFKCKIIIKGNGKVESALPSDIYKPAIKKKKRASFWGGNSSGLELLRQCFFLSCPVVIQVYKYKGNLVEISLDHYSVFEIDTVSNKNGQYKNQLKKIPYFPLPCLLMSKKYFTLLLWVFLGIFAPTDLIFVTD